MIGEDIAYISNRDSLKCVTIALSTYVLQCILPVDVSHQACVIKKLITYK